MPELAHGNFSGKRLVIFGCGYVGGEVARQALARGLRVTALTRNAEKAAELAAAGVATVVGDLADPGWHARIAGGAEYVLNTVSAGGGGVDGYRHSYLEGMRSILAWAAQCGPVGTLVYTSSTSVYPQDGGVRVDESASTDGGSERAAVLVAAERLLTRADGKGGSAGDGAMADGAGGAGCAAAGRAFVLRLAGIYGPGRRHLVDQVTSGAVGGRGDHHLNLVHRDDIAAAIWACFAAPAEVSEWVFNVADDGGALKADVVAWLAGRLGVAMPEFTGAPVGGRRAITPDRIIDNRRIKTLLGWRPAFPTFREGYEKMLPRGAE